MASSSKPALIFTPVAEELSTLLSWRCWIWVKETGPVGLTLWHNVSWLPWHERGWQPVKVFVSDNAHTHTHTPTHSWLSSSRLRVISVLSSPAMVSLVGLCWLCSFSGVCVCVWEHVGRSSQPHVGPLHCSNVPDRGCIDSSMGSSYSARQSFLLDVISGLITCHVELVPVLLL